MNKKQLLFLVGFGILVVAGAYFVSRKQNAAYQSNDRKGAKLLEGIDINAVATLYIRGGSNDVTIAKKGETWVVKERADYPANFDTIRDLMRKFWDLKIARSVAAGSTRLSTLGLGGTDKNSTLLEMRTEDGKLLRSLLIGTNSLNEARGFPSGRYVMLDNDPKSVCLVADDLWSVDSDAGRWLNKDFFKVEKLKSISVVTPVATNNWTMTRDTESAEWKLADAGAGEIVDSNKTSSLSNLLASPSFNDVIPGVGAMENATVATLETFEGFIYTVTLAKKTDDTCQIQLAVRASLPKERAIGKDEKPEDKEKLDKVFKENFQKLEQKLKTEQSYTNCTYAGVSKWTLEQLLKERKEFLVEKKEEKKEIHSAVSPAMAVPSPVSP